MKSKEKVKKKKKPSSRIPLIIILFLLITLLFLLTLPGLQILNLWVGGNHEVTPQPPTLAPPPEIPVTPIPCDIELGFQPIENNSDWTPCEKAFDGIPMMLVPVGCYRFNGTEDQPETEYCFDTPYWIDKYEITNEAYGALKCSHWSTAPYQPYVCVDWHDALEFCKSRNAHLPSEQEWEYAARGVDNLLYPWGNEWDNHKVHWNIESSNKTVSVSSYSEGMSWVGAFHMSGNVWEWVTSTSAYNIARGGSYNSSTVDLPTTIFRIRHGSYNGNVTGFRCARDLDEQD